MNAKKFRVKVTMSEQTARRLSWSIAVFSVILVMIGLVISILAEIAANGQLGPFSHQFFTPVLTLTFGVVGALVASRHPRNPIGWIFCASGFLSALNMFGTGYALYDQLAVKSGSLPGAAFARWLNTWLWLLNGLLPLTFLLLLFPNGRLPSPRWRPIAWAAGLGTLALIVAIAAFHPVPGKAIGLIEANPLGIQGRAEVMQNALMAVATPLLLVGIVGSIASVVVRFRNATGIERAQLKWLAFAGMLVVPGIIMGTILWSIWPDDPLVAELSKVISGVMLVNIVIATGIAILRYRLWDIDIVVNRTLVYGSLTALIVGMYVVLVGSLGTVLQTGASLPVSLFATGIVATSFQPLRERLQRGVNRLMYGERDDPYAVLGRLSQRLEGVVASQAVLPTIVETVAEALKLPYAAMALKEGEDFRIAAEHARAAARKPTSDAKMEILPLVYQLETMGQLILAPRAPGEPFSPTDRRLLETIARQAGIAAYNVRLTQDLQRSRERLVTTREEERRRLRRDLHDGLGPVLASLSFKLDAVHNLADHDPEAVKKMAGELKTQMQGALMDIRRIAYDLRPPALDELGLVGALREHITACNQSGNLQIALEAPENIPALRAAVEVAAYRIAMEALTNVSRHANARHCIVRLALEDRLCLEIDDDGQGLPSNVRAGVGLSSMRERAEELGGTCAVETQPQQGTCVLVQLPC
jgi:signal transduction histidine kinase